MAKTRKIKLTDDYTNWWAVAGDIYGGKRGQRAYAILKAANPGVTRFTRGMTIRVPDIDVSRVRLSDQEVARERGEVDQYGNPTDAYWKAKSNIGQQNVPQNVPQTMGTMSSPIENFYANQYGSRPTTTQTSGARTTNYSRAANPSVPMMPNLYTKDRVGERQGMQLPEQDFYYYFYPERNIRKDVPVEENAQRQREQMNAYYARGRVQQVGRADPRRGRGYTQLTPEQANTNAGRQFLYGQYGSQYGRRIIQPDRRQQAAAPLAFQAVNSPGSALAAGMLGSLQNTPETSAQGETASERRFRQGQYVDQYGEFPTGETPEQLAKRRQRNQLITGTVYSDRDYTWLEPWMKRNNITSPEDLAKLDDTTLTMMWLLGLVEPADEVASQAVRPSASYSGYTGYTPPRYYGGGSGGGGGGSGYGSYSYPSRAGGTRSYNAYMNLVSWRI